MCMYIIIFWEDAHAHAHQWIITIYLICFSNCLILWINNYFSRAILNKGGKVCQLCVLFLTASILIFKPLFMQDLYTRLVDLSFSHSAPIIVQFTISFLKSLFIQELSFVDFSLIIFIWSTSIEAQLIFNNSSFSLSGIPRSIGSFLGTGKKLHDNSIFVCLTTTLYMPNCCIFKFLYFIYAFIFICNW